MHLHYSPFQFATIEQVSNTDVNVKKVARTLKKLTKSDKTHDMHSTMSCSEAATIPGTPTAFISPNAPGTMKDLKLPMAPVGVAPAPQAAPAYDHSHRTRSRQGYGDRAVVMTHGDMIV
jgi:hypothetical protein